MRTTLDIADDVLYAARELSRREKKSLGQVMSDLARQAFAQQPLPRGRSPGSPVADQLGLLGIQPLSSRGGVVSPELIDRLFDDETP
jgi:hypothetical protein